MDIHTHYDGQVTWDPLLTPSSGHGVTTVMFGNCGVGFAPCREGDRLALIDILVSVEDIPGTGARSLPFRPFFGAMGKMSTLCT